MGKFHEYAFPGETEAYRSARDELLAAEAKLREHVEEVAKLRRALPAGGAVPEDYAFDEVDVQTGEARKVHLSELFEPDTSSLVLYSFMFGPDWDEPCPACTSIADSFQGNAGHFTQRVSFAVVTKAPPEKIAAWARKRGWSSFRILSSLESGYNADYLAQTPDDPNDQYPMINVFVRKDGEIRHFWGSELLYTPWEGGHPRHADMLWPVWNVLDLTPEGRGADWFPQLSY